MSLWSLGISRRAKSRPVSLLFSAHRGLLPSKFEGYAILTHNRLLPAYLFGAAVVGRMPQQLPGLPRLCQGRRCPYNADTPKFLVRRPQWAVARKTVRPGFARRMNIPSPQEGVPRNRGSGAATPMSARSAQALIEGAPRRRFGYFAAAGKVTPFPPPPRRAELSPKPTPFP